MATTFKVLLVDDQQIVLDGLKEQLHWSRFCGAICGCVSDGLQALELLKCCRPDAIISDIKMPHMDGIELARQIDESPLLSGIPIILLSGYREFAYAQSANQLPRCKHSSTVLELLRRTPTALAFCPCFARPKAGYESISVSLYI